jgi:hypothetical protein
MPHAGGRPTKYDPKYCEEVIEYMGRGFSKTAFAGRIGIARNTLLNWADENPEFLRAIKIGESSRTGALEEQMLSEDLGPRVTARIFALKNACREEWQNDTNNDQQQGNKETVIRVVGGFPEAFERKGD